MSEISKIDMMIAELEGACEVEHSVTQDSITALVASCGRAHTEITRLRKELEFIRDGTNETYANNMVCKTLMEQFDVREVKK